MKLITAIIHDDDAHGVMDELSKHGFGVTKLASTGGFLKSGNTTLIIGAEEDKVEEAIKLIEKRCKSRKQITSANLPSTEGYIPYPIEVTVGGATIFVLDVDQFKKI
ncbi:cyclic-di-AMP receptor [Defluviitalea phaphyphila]|uniref:cyclic-di-AMP receptor n=1 Tax=Defluviitalea phaphyphila TaxID=1473580 RepID=UPI000731DB16|nr:cyclic-di-AMP receptor [Defluviitalea phaphyphila]